MAKVPAQSAELVALLEAQREDYQAMYAAGLAQRESLARDDMSGVHAALARANALMGRIRLRQARLPANLGSNSEPDVGERTRALRDAILRVERLRQSNEDAVRLQLQETRDEIRRSGRGRKVARGYRGRQVEGARFFDRRR